MRLAMWSGPRNISTALMRSWENRPDTRVVDEPLYAYYLRTTGVDHPGRDEVIAAGETSWQVVVDELTAPVEGGAPQQQAQPATSSPATTPPPRRPRRVGTADSDGSNGHVVIS